MQNLKYLLRHTGKWHAWPRGGTRTLCGTVTLDDLRITPAKRIQQEPPVGEPFCKSCHRRLGPGAQAALATPSGRTKHLTPTALVWLGLVRRHLALVRVHVREADELALAQRLALVGPPEDPQAASVYEHLRALLLTPRLHLKRDARTTRKIPHLHEALEMLPPDAKALAHVAESMRLWRHITGDMQNTKTTTSARFQPDVVIQTMLQITNPEPYIRALHAKGLSPLGAMFHPNTLARAKQRDPSLRGAFHKDSAAYWEQTQKQLHVVKD